MCGLVGIAGNLEYKDEATMKRLLLFDYFRGTDSTGLASITMGGDTTIAKIASNPIDLFEMPKFKNGLNANVAQAFIGHNRAATRGATSNYNAHPFHYGDVTGAHNGTLDYQSTKLLEEIQNETFAVDSQALFSAINQFGLDGIIPMINEGATSSDGAWALTYYDKKTDTMNFIRNRWRPLWYAIEKDKKRIFWASEWPMIEAAIQMSVNGYELLADEKGYTYWQFDVDTHYQFDMTELREGIWEDPRKGVIKGKEPKPAAQTSGTKDPFDRKDTGGTGCGFHSTMTTIGQPKGTGGTTTTSLGKTEKTVIHLLGYNDSPFAGIVTEEEFNKISYGGCSFCGEDIDFNDVGITIYEREEKCLCPTCSGAPADKTKAANKVYATDPALIQL
jgi:predicted glutamine amidotransferase